MTKLNVSMFQGFNVSMFEGLNVSGFQGCGLAVWGCERFW